MTTHRVYDTNLIGYDIPKVNCSFKKNSIHEILKKIV